MGREGEGGGEGGGRGGEMGENVVRNSSIQLCRHACVLTAIPRVRVR